MWARESLPPVMIIFLVLNTIAVGLRVYVRYFMTKAFSYDDWAMVVAFVSETIKHAWKKTSDARVAWICSSLYHYFHLGDERLWRRRLRSQSLVQYDNGSQGKSKYQNTRIVPS